MGLKEKISTMSRKEVLTLMFSASPHCRELGMEVIAAEPGRLTLLLPYRADIIGNPVSGVIHGGALTTLLDSACGFAVQCALFPELDTCPTLDLRIDYMRSAEPNKPVYATAECYRMSSNVAFTRGIAYQEDKANPICHCVATFMRLKIGRNIVD